MQRHESRYAVAAPREKVWGFLHPPPQPQVPGQRRRIDYPGGNIEIIQEGDETGEGLVRTCVFQVPTWLLTKGEARSWEVVSETRMHEYARYEAIGKPLWSRAEGWHELSDLTDGRTGLRFVETYHAFNPISRLLLEKRVHRFISHHNEQTYLKVLGYLGAVEKLS